MNEQKYLMELEIELKILNPNERKDVLRDFTEYFENEKKKEKLLKISFHH